MNLLFIVLGLALLILGGNWLLKSAVGMSLMLHIPKIVIGMTVVSLATSAPELIVSIKAALNGFPDLAMGNVVGSNVANLGLVLAITIILMPIDVERSFYKTDWPVMMIASCLLFGFVITDAVLQRYEGIVLVCFLVVFLVYLLRTQAKAVVEDTPTEDEVLPGYKILIFMVVGGIALWGGSELLISGAVGMAEFYGVSKRVIAVTVVSVGTSIPELAASIIAVLKKEKAISLGNLIGSNVFNILAVLGVTAIIQPIHVNDGQLLTNDIYWMLGISFVVLPLVFIPKGLRLGWRDGVVLLIIYILFVWLTLK
ncbi:calcium/sodium antiporter [Galbibacter pacificus]|uniref:Calcium/sodium antiporter n=1 Tax=Galbibacter pacificus TaxID=2996052 RepID=A0ABT6FVM8_9FLAO|nr:calcium/sodium antiporter [Galbibacter pacificus]MDG3583928.1 calcium/sodium antiporter [Galbibacter pacificus]MDG3587154.1 calcium/sodium antiporter [Galbibacter pacificus]